MKRLSLIPLLASLLLLAACSTTPPVPESVKYRSGELKGVIMVQKSVVVLTEGGLPQAKAILKNTAGVTQKFEYKFVWFDDNDMPIDEDSRPWRPATVAGNDEMTVSGTGPSDKAKKYQIQLRKPQGVTQ